MAGNLIDYRVEKGVAILELNDPPANTYTYEMNKELDTCILNARMDDARFDVMIAQGLGRAGILGLVPRVMKGTHITHPAVRMEQAARVVIDSPDPLVVEADGEIPFLDAHHLEIELLPRRLRLIV